ncbi:MarR family winged helix-turn-helix transcriptional regulator [Citrobacter koseri]|uniref:MarR family winged helix-turn-helix transcriptional regulator n=1 Tax=Citrobacter koseri TaxID=545 RepID=UPI0023B1873C|nr:MarR family transcriptional regulator [Citrobacter koseri]
MSVENEEHANLLIEMAETILHVARKLHAYSLQKQGITSLSSLEYLLILHIQRHPGVSPSDLAGELALRSSNAAAAIRGLTAKRLVERRGDSSDKRVVRLFLTSLAEEAIVNMRSSWTELLLQTDTRLDELRSAVAVLTAIDIMLAEP